MRSAKGGQGIESATPSSTRDARTGTCSVGQNHKCIGIYGVHTVFLAGKSPYIRSPTVQIYGSGQP